ncbi:hypothetical protein BJY01DRAFT_237764 [Aspergillus pseudoustus]|uniref:Fungal STAND N-terminal Goodbye domain-containing protein n=1 Tax=Aspergillus pseudoustus TaxID=1810923 RepID=A0ABR4JCF9_9EURO
MASVDNSMPQISGQPPTIDFIDNRLPKHHMMFQNPPIHYEPSHDRYVANKDPANPMASGGGNIPHKPLYPFDPYDLPPRPADTDIKAMTFWTWLFPLAMADLTSKVIQPNTKTAYRIRNKPDWESVYEILEAARGEYCAEDGKRKLFRKVRRRAADGVAPVVEAAHTVCTLAPNSPFSTPVLGAVVIILDALKTTADVRQQALTGFEGLAHLFSDVELFLGTFHGDENILRASIELTVSTLGAIEQAIYFFTTHGLLRGGKALFTGSQYGQELQQGLAEIKTRSQDLMTEAAKSHIHNFHLCTAVHLTLDGVNSIKDLLSEHLRERDTEIAKIRLQLHWQNSQLQLQNEHITYLESRAPSPIPVLRTPIVDTYVSQQALRRMLDTSDIHLNDIIVVTDTKSRLPAKERAQAEQIVTKSAFRQWIILPVSAKLLVHWDLSTSKTRSGVSPLSGVCATMSQALAAQPRFISLLWFAGRQVERISAGEDVGENFMLRSLIDQLLRQFDFDMRFFQHSIDPSCPKSDLLILFEWLIRQLPQTETLCCVIDGVAQLEREEYEAESLPVFSKLVQLVNDPSVAAAIKLLLTSTPATTVVRAAFEDEGLILNVNAFPRQSLPSNEERLIREVGATVSAGE